MEFDEFDNTPRAYMLFRHYSTLCGTIRHTIEDYIKLYSTKCHIELYRVILCAIVFHRVLCNSDVMLYNILQFDCTE